MSHRLKTLTESQAWHLLVNAATKALEAEGYTLTRMPGRGLANMWSMERDGVSQHVAIRTTRIRWFAFPPLQGGTTWKTLKDADYVAVATVDSRDDPKTVEIYLFPAEVVRQRFDLAYAARAEAGHALRDDYGMWVALDAYERGLAIDVGSGLAQEYQPIAEYPIMDLIADGSWERVDADVSTLEVEDTHPKPITPAEAPDTIADVIAWARQRIATIAGVAPSAVRVDVKLEV